MFPKSAHKGQAITTFPDVCFTPALGGPAPPVPIPYPNIGMTGNKATRGGRKVKVERKSVMHKSAPQMQMSSGNEAGVLKGQLSALHQKIMTMPPGDATAWHKVLDEYVVKSAQVYQLLSSDH